MGSHTGRYASVCALFYEKTGDQAFKEKSFRSFNWATYMAHEDGLITEAMAEDNFWYSDGRHNPGQIGPPARGQPSPPENYPEPCEPCSPLMNTSNSRGYRGLPAQAL